MHKEAKDADLDNAGWPVTWKRVLRTQRLRQSSQRAKKKNNSEVPIMVVSPLNFFSAWQGERGYVPIHSSHETGSKMINVNDDNVHMKRSNKLEIRQRYIIQVLDCPTILESAPGKRADGLAFACIFHNTGITKKTVTGKTNFNAD